ncbi:MAG: hypothetical protein IH905_09090 [Proteobacteria bacterium]|nr:hypothetical protein [Pseudomonadota bacterium]
MSSIIRGFVIGAAGLGLLIVGAVALPATAFAASHSRVTQQDDAVEIIFKAIEKQILREYFGGDTEGTAKGRGGKKKAKGGRGGKKKAKGGRGGGSLPPGLAKREKLPPGLERQLVRNGTLPPGISKRALPPGLASRLGSLPAGTERVIVGGDVALIDIATGVILDILKDVLSN